MRVSSGLVCSIMTAYIQYLDTLKTWYQRSWERALGHDWLFPESPGDFMSPVNGTSVTLDVHTVRG